MEALTLWDIPKQAPKSAYEAWNQANPEVYAEFRSLALDLIGRGIRHYGAKAIIEVIRFHRTVHSNDPLFKIDNSLTSYYARKFMREFPEYGDFFETRRSKLDI